MQNNQNRRRVFIDEDILRQLLSQVQAQGQQALVPNQGAVPAEYQIYDEGTLRDDAVEIDLNRNRNKILRETWGGMR